MSAVKYLNLEMNRLWKTNGSGAHLPIHRALRSVCTTNLGIGEERSCPREVQGAVRGESSTVIY